MASLIIRNLDDDVKRRLRLRAAARGRSMEAKARDILHRALRDEPQTRDIGRAIHQRFADVGGCDLALPEREPMRPVSNFSP